MTANIIKKLYICFYLFINIIYSLSKQFFNRHYNGLLSLRNIIYHKTSKTELSKVDSSIINTYKKLLNLRNIIYNKKSKTKLSKLDSSIINTYKEFLPLRNIIYHKTSKTKLSKVDSSIINTYKKLLPLWNIIYHKTSKTKLSKFSHYEHYSEPQLLCNTTYHNNSKVNFSW